LKETYAAGRAPGNISCANAPWASCILQAACPIHLIETFINSRACPTAGCSLTADDILRKDEQKQVDTLIVADLGYLALHLREPKVALVSSDTDMWPGVLLCNYSGTNVAHIHRPNSTTQPHLIATLRGSNNYISATL
jgi:uncharacterized LabA/DUF88 family protein